jgi:hypothetical protein
MWSDKSLHIRIFLVLVDAYWILLFHLILILILIYETQPNFLLLLRIY